MTKGELEGLLNECLCNEMFLKETVLLVFDNLSGVAEGEMLCALATFKVILEKHSGSVVAPYLSKMRKVLLKTL